MNDFILRRVKRAMLTGLAALLVTLPLLSQATMVRVHTTQGPIDLQLLDIETPITVANFLAYVNAGDFGNVFFHRSVKNFVVQGGGFRWDSAAATCCTSVTSRGTIQNEYSDLRSNLRGTVAMAKVGGNPNSATSQWFFNLGNNSANLDTQNGGFTVFARVTTPGMAVVDKIAALPIVNAGGTYSELPVTGWSSPNPISRSNVVLIHQVTVFPSLPLQSESDRIFNYLEAAYPDILSPSIGDAGIVDGYAYRYYSGSDSYVGSKDGKVYYRSPTQTNNQITEIGSVADWLALAQSAGY